MDEGQEQELEQKPEPETMEDKRIKALEATKNAKVILDDLDKNKRRYQPGELAWRCLDLLKILNFVLLELLEQPEVEERAYIAQKKLDEGNEGKGDEMETLPLAQESEELLEEKEESTKEIVEEDDDEVLAAESEIYEDDQESDFDEEDKTLEEDEE